MKKIIYITLLLVTQITLLKSQECVTCDQNSTGDYASVIGVNSTALGVGSVAIGSNSHTLLNAGNSIAIGTAVQTVGGLSYVFGCGHDDTYRLSSNH